MFPTVRVSFSGLVRPSKTNDFYAVLLDIVPVDSRRYRYAYHRSAWLVAGNLGRTLSILFTILSTRVVSSETSICHFYFPNLNRIKITSYGFYPYVLQPIGKADPPPPPRLHAHPDTPFTFEALTKQVISFEKAKLTNNEMDRNGQVSII